MARRSLTGTAVILVAALVVLGGAGAADLDASTVALRASDLPGANVSSQGVVKEKGYASSYQRSFSYKAPTGRAGVLAVQSESQVAASAAQPAADVASVRKDLATKRGRTNFAKYVAGIFKVKATAVTVGAPRTPRVGDHAVEFPLTLKVKGGRVYMSLLFMQLDRVLSQFLTVAIRPIASSDNAYATAVAAHVGTALTAAVLTPPTLSGTPQQGQTLTAAPGTTSPADATVAYQWQKCDAAGANCVDLPGATAQTYLVAPTDVGSTLRVNMVATNRFGTSVATPSAITAAVT